MQIKTALIGAAVAAGCLIASANGGSAKELSLSYFMGPKHPMNKAVFTPFAEKIAELCGDALSVKQYPGGALNSAPPKQYSILLEGVADIAFALPGYTSQLFPITNVVTVPGVSGPQGDPVAGTQALLNAYELIEKEYKAKILAVWTNAAPVLITKDKPIRKLEDIKGMKVRVTSAQDVPFVEALGASAVSQPVTVINQNLTNGTIDAIAIDTSAVGSFKLHEPANYITRGLPGSGSAFVLLMNHEVYDGLGAQERDCVDKASGEWLSLSGGKGYQAASARGLDIARKAGVEIIELPDSEVKRFEAAMKPAMDAFLASQISDNLTGADVINKMKGM